MINQLYEHDINLMSKYPILAGFDEAGRGPLAGPVVTACVIMDYHVSFVELNDSKRLSQKLRESLYQRIVESCLEYHIEIVDHIIIDDINILQASLLGFCLCAKKLKTIPSLCLIDGNKTPAEFAYPAKSIIHGDAISACIAAASILAKVTRDRLMIEYDLQFPQYGFAKHKGYATPQHLNAIEEHGICSIHRLSYAPINQRTIWTK